MKDTVRVVIEQAASNYLRSVCARTQNCSDNIKSLALEEKDEFFNLSINIQLISTIGLKSL